jgi:hypothetical protein
VTRNVSHGFGQEGSVPLLTIAAAGTYLATQTTTVSKGTQATVSTNTPSGSVSNQQTYSTQSNNSGLPYGLGFIGGSLATLSSSSIPGTNVGTVLKSAAADLASNVAGSLQLACFDSSEPEAFAWCRELFKFRPPRVCDRDAAYYVLHHPATFPALKSLSDQGLAFSDKRHSCFPVGLVPPHIPPRGKDTRLPYDP